MNNVYLIKQKGSSSYFGFVKNGAHQKPVSMILGFKTKADAQRSRHLLLTHVPDRFKKRVLTLVRTPNPVNRLMESGTFELYKDDMADFSEYLSVFNTRLHIVEEIVIQPEGAKMLVSLPQQTYSKPTPETLALNLQIVYDADEFTTNLD
jgi:hypothetical protein